MLRKKVFFLTEKRKNPFFFKFFAKKKKIMKRLNKSRVLFLVTNTPTKRVFSTATTTYYSTLLLKTKRQVLRYPKSQWLNSNKSSFVKLQIRQYSGIVPGPPDSSLPPGSNPPSLGQENPTQAPGSSSSTAVPGDTKSGPPSSPNITDTPSDTPNSSSTPSESPSSEPSSEEPSTPPPTSSSPKQDPPKDDSDKKIDENTDKDGKEKTEEEKAKDKEEKERKEKKEKRENANEEKFKKEMKEAANYFKDAWDTLLEQARDPSNRFFVFVLLAFTFVSVVGIILDMMKSQLGNMVTLNEFLNKILPEQNVKQLTVRVPTASSKTRQNENQELHVDVSTETGNAYYFKISTADTLEETIEQAYNTLGLRSRPLIKYTSEDGPLNMSSWINSTQSILIPVIIILAAFKAISMFGPGAMSASRSGSIAKRFQQNTSKNGKKITFKDVAGIPEAKLEISEFITFLKKPEAFVELGGKIPKGALLVGPPGTGKTLLAKAAAGEADVPFYYMAGSDFIEMYVGVGPQRVRELFKQARKTKPSIVFIDEIDAIGRKREGNPLGRHDERDNTLNALLVEMDGFTNSDGVVVFGGTNRDDVLDKALLRPGRFDRKIRLENPELKSRIEIFLIHLQPLVLNFKDSEQHDTIEKYAKRCAELTPGFSGAEVANVCNEAALIGARNNKDSISLIEFEAAIDRSIGGIEKKSKVVRQDERERVAHHEAGHAIVGWFSKFCDPLLKVSIVPRGESALGFAQYLPTEDKHLTTKSQIFDEMCKALGGRVAEELIYGSESISTGAEDDLEKVTKMAYGTIVRYGLGEEVGLVSFPMGEELSGGMKPYSEKTSELIDKEVRGMIERAYQVTKEILKSKIDNLKTVAAELLKKEVLKRVDLELMLGERIDGKKGPLEELKN